MIDGYNFYVSPSEGAPLWWNINDGDGLSTGFPYNAAKGISMPDEVRLDAYRLPYNELSSHWRIGTEQEARSALWETMLP